MHEALHFENLDVAIVFINAQKELVSCCDAFLSQFDGANETPLDIAKRKLKRYASHGLDETCVTAWQNMVNLLEIKSLEGSMSIIVS